MGTGMKGHPTRSPTNDFSVRDKVVDVPPLRPSVDQGQQESGLAFRARMPEVRVQGMAVHMIRISEAVGRQIACPDNHCGHAAPVRHSTDRVSEKGDGEPIDTAHLWYLVDCPRSGRKLYRAHTMVEVVGE